MNPRLKEEYEKKIVPEIQKKFSMKNKLMVPKVNKVVENIKEEFNLNEGPSYEYRKPLKNIEKDMKNFSIEV